MTRIENHRIAGVPFVESRSRGGELDPEAVVLHYTATQTAESAIRTLTDRNSSVSAHLVIDRDGTVTQLVPFDRVAWHAGESSWRGRSGLNAWSIGIELVNPGPVFREGDRVRDVYGQTWLGEHAEFPVLPGFPAQWKRWALYTGEQLRALEDVCRALVRAYALPLIVGHSDVSPRRKFDPGPALPIGRIREYAFSPDPSAPPRPEPLAEPVSVAGAVVSEGLRDMSEGGR